MPALPKEVKYGEDLSLDKAPVLSAEELHTLKLRQAAMDKLLASQKRGKYKLEIMFGSAYRSGQAYPGAISLWLSGSKLHGGGDEKVYCCPRCLQTFKGQIYPTKALILPSAQGYGFGVCSQCGTTSKAADMRGEILLRLTTQDWTECIYRWVRTLEFNSDLYLKRPKLDLRVAANLEQARQRGGEKLLQVRQKLEKSIYPLAHLLHDTAGGASFPARIRAFLEA
jgi:hypothetical protein